MQYLVRRLLRSGCIQRRFASKDSHVKEIYQQLSERAEKYRRELSKHIISSKEHRQLRASLNSIGRTISDMETRRKQLKEIFEQPARPGLVSLEVRILFVFFFKECSLQVISNGTTHMQPAVFIRTEKRVYLFNCPEGMSRFMSSLRLRPQVVHDIFITRGTKSILIC